VLSRRLVNGLAAVFFFSGLSSLVCQVAWQRVLTLYAGVGAVSIAIIVSVYMLGLGLGSLAGGRLAERSRDPCLLFAGIEVALAAAVYTSVPAFEALGRATAGGHPAVALACMFAFLTVPTFLMGLTLPPLTILVSRASGSFDYAVSHLYFVNTLGAAVGALVASYVLVPLVGLDGCLRAAAAINVGLAAVVLLAGRRGRQPATGPRPAVPPGGVEPILGRLVYGLVTVSGFMAIGYEIVWFRVIGVLVKDSPYAFSSVLAVYLLGVALGSRWVHAYVGKRPGVSRRDLFMAIQFLVGLSVLATFVGFVFLSRFEPLQTLARLSFAAGLHPSPDLFLHRPGSQTLVDLWLLLDVFAWPAAILLVPTMLMGAGFPLVASLALSRAGREGSAVGTTYFFLVAGNVLGGLVTALFLLPAIGTEATILAFGSAGLMFGLAARTFGVGRCPLALRATAVVALLVAAAVAFPRPGELYAAMHRPGFTPVTTRIEEGRDAVVVTYEAGERLRNYVNGQGHGYRPGPFFFAEAFGGLAAALSPRRVLVIGLGTGTITEAALSAAGVERVTVVELCESVVANLRAFPVVARILADPRVRVVVGDGRRYLRQTGERFDVILMDPLRPTTAYSNNVHSREFFALAASRLAPGGTLMVGGTEGSAVVPRTLLEVFRYVRAFGGFSVASGAPLAFECERVEPRLAWLPEDARAMFRDLLAGSLEGPALARAVAPVQPNEDWRPRSEYYLRRPLAGEWGAR
jgi:spermidine synthase